MSPHSSTCERCVPSSVSSTGAFRAFHGHSPRVSTAERAQEVLLDVIELLHAVGDTRADLGQPEVSAQAPLRLGGDARDLGTPEVEGHAVGLAVRERHAEAFSGRERHRRSSRARGNHTHGRLRG